MSVTERDDAPPSFLRRGNPGQYAPPLHPDRMEGLADLARALEDFRTTSGERREQIARLISELPVHEALEMATQIETCQVDDVSKPELATMLRLNMWARFVLTGEKENAASES